MTELLFPRGSQPGAGQEAQPTEQGWAAEGAPGHLCCEGSLGEPRVLSLNERKHLLIAPDSPSEGATRELGRHF